MKVAVLFGGLLVKETSLSPETYRVDYPIPIIAPYPIPIHIIDYNNKLVNWHLGYNAQIELGLEISKKSALSMQIGALNSKGNLIWGFPLVFRHAL